MATSAADKRATYTAEEVAAILGLGRSLTYEAIHRGEIPSVRIGKRLLVPRAAVERMLLGSPTTDE